ncbi:hypothetical protein JJB07_00405 [Tumebacillus sp. ITR2]|uniref:LysM domain-containing protein n=1 Tax=Tumebacillus amylolyticus TaxID=2801339 RepID=A0ABS1J495_9BACL|nr:hypothetical protein [Tumebacillus amylolyticus]MBL0385091.1 hypothetical protein [Tumebacillus amylolyticus]
MKKFTKYAVALATVVALGGTATYAMAATSTTTNKTATNDQQQKGKGHGEFFNQNNTELQTLLKLSADELTTQLKAGKSLADIASAQGVDKQAVIDLLVKQDAAHIDQDVKDGKLTADQATQMKANSVQHATDQVDGKGGFGGPGGKRGGHGGPGGPGFHLENNTDLQTLLKLSADELTTQLKAGKSLADIASAQGVDKQAVIDLLVKQDAAHIDQDVKDGKLTADQATQCKANSVQHATDEVDGKGGFGGPGGDRDGHEGPGGPGFRLENNTDLQTLLKLSADELTTQLKAGKSLADIASAQGVEKQAVIDLLVKQDAAHLDQDVKDGKLTAEQAAQMKTDSVQHATDQVEGKGGFGGKGGKGGKGGFGGDHGQRGGHGAPNGQQGQSQTQQPSTQTQQ